MAYGMKTSFETTLVRARDRMGGDLVEDLGGVKPLQRIIVVMRGGTNEFRPQRYRPREGVDVKTCLLVFRVNRCLIQYARWRTADQEGSTFDRSRSPAMWCCTRDLIG